MASVESRAFSESDVLGHLLHSLCQPLTTLRCSLELALDEFTEQRSETVATALEQADRAIETVQLMREYLEIERGSKAVQAVALAAAVEAVLTQLSVVAEAHHVPLLASGKSTAVMAVNDFWLQRALRCLIEVWLENPSAGSAIVVLLEDRASQVLLSVYRLQCEEQVQWQAELGKSGEHLRQAKLAIARRVLESAGASLEFCSDLRPGFIVHIPQSKALAQKLSA